MVKQEKQDVLQLVKKAQHGSAGALEALVCTNMGLVKKIANRFATRGFNCEWEDLCQVGVMGLLRAIKNFDSKRGTQFSTYAFPCILGEIRRYIQKQSSLKLSRNYYLLAVELKKQTAQLRAEYEEEPSIALVASRLGVSCEDALLALEGTQHAGDVDFQSIENQPVMEGNPAVLDEEILSLQMVVSTLDYRSRLLIYLRYFQGLTQLQTGKKMGISQVHVSRLEREIKRKIKENLR